MPEASVTVSFKDLEADEEIRQVIDERCQGLAGEFPEAARFEITLTPDGAGHQAHARIHGGPTHLDAHGSAIELGLAAERALEKIEHQLRHARDKRLFARRREAKKANPKRGVS